MPLELQAQGGRRIIEAVIGTGFTGWLTLPPAIIASFGLIPQGQETVILADGARSTLTVYLATMIWDGQPQSIPVHEADAEPLVGMSLLHGHDLQIRVVDGGAVTIIRVP